MGKGSALGANAQNNNTNKTSWIASRKGSVRKMERLCILDKTVALYGMSFGFHEDNGMSPKSTLSLPPPKKKNTLATYPTPAQTRGAN
eukprot:5325336-Pyramimonas_sp.AAC.1